MYPAGVLHRNLPVAFRDLGAQIGQRDVGTIARDEAGLLILPLAPAFVAGEAQQIGGVVAEAESAIHLVRANRWRAKQRWLYDT